MRRVWILRGIFALLFLASALALLFMNRKNEPGSAGVYQDGKMVLTIPEGAEGTYRVEGDDGSCNVIQAGPDGIRVVESSCPDHICEHTVWKGNSSIPIICLPNRLVIKAADVEEDLGLDGVTY